MAAPWETSKSTRSHKRDAHRCAHHCRRRIPDHATSGLAKARTNGWSVISALPFTLYRKSMHDFSVGRAPLGNACPVSPGPPGPHAGLRCLTRNTRELTSKLAHVVKLPDGSFEVGPRRWFLALEDRRVRHGTHERNGLGRHVVDRRVRHCEVRRFRTCIRTSATPSTAPCWHWATWPSARCGRSRAPGSRPDAWESR